jgi:hypothetical protein
MGLDSEAFGFIETLTRLAEQFGPFLFAILFIVFVTRTARSYYVECMTRTAPPWTAQEQKTYRLYFLCSVWGGVAVMTLSLGWWFYRHAKGNYVYQISVVNLSPEEKIVSEFYSRTNVHQTVVPGVAPNHDALFLVVRDQPYTSGQTLSFTYVKQTAVANGTGSTPLGSALVPQQVEIKYSGGNILSYRIVSDGSGTRLETFVQHNSASGIFTAEEIQAAVQRYASAEKALDRRP